MQGLVFDIRSFSVHDGPGIRQTIFLKGCPLRCAWCHNPESHESGPEPMTRYDKIGQKTFVRNETAGRWMSVEEVMAVVEKDILFFEESGGGVTLSGGEPLMQPAFSLKLLQECKKQGLQTALDTCGYAPWEAFEAVIPFTDLFLYDLKLVDPLQHLKHTGKDNHLIISNLLRLSKTGKKITIRIPLIPGITDTEANLGVLKDLLAGLPRIKRIDLLPYHNTALKKYQRLGKHAPIPDSAVYDAAKAEQIKSDFEYLAPLVSIGG